MDPTKYITFWNGEDNFMKRIILVLNLRVERNKVEVTIKQSVYGPFFDANSQNIPANICKTVANLREYIYITLISGALLHAVQMCYNRGNMFYLIKFHEYYIKISYNIICIIFTFSYGGRRER
jgi:hypothetical protein